MQKLLYVAATLAACSFPVHAQSLFATSVVDFQQGSGGGLFDTSLILGGPLGAGLGSGSLDVLTLGDGGSVTLGFDVTIVDGPGADFSVFENGFAFGSAVFAEIAYVEVSTDGVAFARFDSSYGPVGGGAGGGTEMGAFSGVAGGMPVLANVSVDPTSPFDPSSSGGESFDLAELTDHPAVLAGTVDLDDVRFVRLADVLPGESDSSGQLFVDGGFGGADFDAVAVLHHANGPATPPVCDLELDAAGHLVMRLGDPDGFSDLNPATLALSVNLVPLPFDALFQFMVIDSFDGQVGVLRTPSPVTGAGVTLALGLSVSDDGGDQSGDQLMVQDV